MSLSDGMPTMTMPVAPANTGNDGDFGWGGGNGVWLIVLFLIFAVCGVWGNNGWGGNGSGVVDGYVLTSDFANIERKLDGVNNGICDGFYAMNTGMLNGFAGVTQTVTSGFSQAEVARCTSRWRLCSSLAPCRHRWPAAAAIFAKRFRGSTTTSPHRGARPAT